MEWWLGWARIASLFSSSVHFSKVNTQGSVLYILQLQRGRTLLWICSPDANSIFFFLQMTWGRATDLNNNLNDQFGTSFMVFVHDCRGPLRSRIKWGWIESLRESLEGWNFPTEKWAFNFFSTKISKVSVNCIQCCFLYS